MRPRRDNYYRGNNRGGKFSSILAIALIIVGIGVLAKTKDTPNDKSINGVKHSQTANSASDSQLNNTQNSIVDETQTAGKEVEAYHIGDEILVETNNGKYSLCITGVSETPDRNQFSDKQADRAVIIDYKFENISHSTDFQNYHNDELFISELDFSMYDADGERLETYPAEVKYAKSVSIGHKSSGQMAYALNNSQNYIEAEYHDNMFMSSDFTIILEW